ncbi:hypothetical protein N9571_02115 [Yoonia sp.]|mgnify:CR=1 FL=1|uniref:hypothetical protein n=1 Tax=Yoonia sp. TaxID=2212373 RepID=UPI00236969B4|nr:hypothetical protein [Yoonia sp.]MDB4111342.1 hypothetical protein [Yoonia sp.]
MGNDWIIEVLADLQSFADHNDMPLLCAQLDEAMLIATVEVATRRHHPAQWSGDDSAPSDAIGKD